MRERLDTVSIGGRRIYHARGIALAGHYHAFSTEGGAWKASPAVAEVVELDSIDRGHVYLARRLDGTLLGRQGQIVELVELKDGETPPASQKIAVKAWVQS